MKAQRQHHYFARLIMLTAIIGLALMAVSLFQAPLEPILQKGYSLLTLGTSGLLALHYSLLH